LVGLSLIVSSWVLGPNISKKSYDEHYVTWRSISVWLRTYIQARVQSEYSEAD
jgi:hypothetical protein